MRERESAAPGQASRWRMFLRPTGKEIRLILVVYAVFLAGFLALVWL